MIVLSIIFCIIKGYNFDKSILIIVLSLYKLLEAFSEGLYAVIQKNEELYKVGISLFVKTLLSIILFVIVDLITNNLLLSSITIIISNLIIIVLYDFNNVKNCKIKITKINYNNVFTILKIGFFTFVFSILTQYVINSTRYAIDNHLEDKFQTIYGIIIMPSTFIALLAQLYIHPFLNKMKKALTVSKKEFNIIVIKLCLALFASGLLCIVVAYSLGIPVLEFLYNVDLKDYKNGLLLILGGATIYSNVAILSTALITMRSTLSQVIVFVNVSIIAYFLSNMLVSNYSMNGAVYSYLSIMIILFIEYIITYIFILNKRR
jgi:O-antigen/teichoic acid export membrane protein